MSQHAAVKKKKSGNDFFPPRRVGLTCNFVEAFTIIEKGKK